MIIDILEYNFKEAFAKWKQLEDQYTKIQIKLNDLEHEGIAIGKVVNNKKNLENEQENVKSDAYILKKYMEYYDDIHELNGDKKS